MANLIYLVDPVLTYTGLRQNPLLSLWGGIGEFGECGLIPASLTVQDNSTIRIPLERLKGNLGVMHANIKVVSSGLDAVEGVNFSLPVLPPIPGANPVYIRWEILFLGTLGSPFGEIGLKYLEVKLLGAAVTTLSFTLEIETVIASLGFGANIPDEGSFITPGKKTVTINIIPDIKEAGIVYIVKGIGINLVTPESATLAVEVARGQGSVGAVTVDFNTLDGTAVDGVNYSAVSGTLNWADGDVGKKVINIPILTVSSNLQFALQLLNPTNGLTFGDQGLDAALIDIFDLPAAAGDLAISVQAVQADELTVVTVRVKRVNGDSGAVSVQFREVNGTALAGTHYTSITGTLNWGDGDSADKTWNITLLAVNGPQFFSAEIHTPGGGAGLLSTKIGYNFQRITILDSVADAFPFPPTDDEIEDAPCTMIFTKSSLAELGLGVTMNTSLVCGPGRLIGNVLGFGDPIDSFGLGDELPPQPGFLTFTEKDKYKFIQGAGADA